MEQWKCKGGTRTWWKFTRWRPQSSRSPMSPGCRLRSMPTPAKVEREFSVRAAGGDAEFAEAARDARKIGTRRSSDQIAHGEWRDSRAGAANSGVNKPF